MRRILAFLAAASLAGGALAAAPGRADVVRRSSRVIVSATLNDTLQFFDAATLAETQPPLPSKGSAPVRLWVERFGPKPYLFSADHGVEGGLGVFDLSGDLVTELPASPFPARPGAVGVVAGTATVGARAVPMVFLTNTWQALGGCGLPAGSVTAYDASLLATAGVVTEAGTLDVSGSIPYAVALKPDTAQAFVSTNCGNTLDTVKVGDAGALGGPSIARTATRATGRGPDGAIYDPATGLVYVANIGGNSLSVFDATATGARTTVPLAGAGPIDIALADTPAGRRYVVTSDGGADAVSLVDRDVIAACVAAAAPVCDAEAARLATQVAGGAPEGVAYDPASNRIFVVNKGIFAPSLSVLDLDESGAAPSVRARSKIAIGAAGTAAPVPAAIAFDVVVQTR
jgi:DNA-binding beta-propeller fold protein YncE